MIHFEFININEVVGNIYSGEQKEFNIQELLQCGKSNVNSDFVAVKDLAHGFSNKVTWTGAEEVGFTDRINEIDTYDFSPDDWVRYINPLVDSALEEVNSGINLQHVFQKFILIGIFVGQGRTFKQATEQIEEWERTGISQLLKESRMIDFKFFHYEEFLYRK